MPFCAIVVVVVVLCSVPRNVVDCLSLHLLSIVSRSISNPYGYIAHHTLLIYLLLLSMMYHIFIFIIYHQSVIVLSIIFFSFFLHTQIFLLPTDFLLGGRGSTPQSFTTSSLVTEERLFAHLCLHSTYSVNHA